MDALSPLLMLNAPQGTIDKNCVLGSVDLPLYFQTPVIT